MIQHQWVMFEDHDIPLCDALFRLRATRSSIVRLRCTVRSSLMGVIQILESTNSLISLLAEVSDPLFLFGVLRDALSQYLACFPDLAVSQASAASHTAGSAMDGERARASGYLFGLNGMGMCILKLPKEVVEVEARRLATVITDVSICSQPQACRAENLAGYGFTYQHHKASSKYADPRSPMCHW